MRNSTAMLELCIGISKDFIDILSVISLSMEHWELSHTLNRYLPKGGYEAIHIRI